MKSASFFILPTRDINCQHALPPEPKVEIRLLQDRVANERRKLFNYQFMILNNLFPRSCNTYKVLKT